jgi:hypothetical protein
MPDLLTITLPNSVSQTEIAEIAQALKEVQAVESVQETTSRGLDPATIKVWIEVAVGVIGFLSAAMPVIKKVIATIRGKGITGAKIKLPNGTEISVDNASSEEIEKILKATEQK